MLLERTRFNRRHSSVLFRAKPSLSQPRICPARVPWLFFLSARRPAEEEGNERTEISFDAGKCGATGVHSFSALWEHKDATPLTSETFPSRRSNVNLHPSTCKTRLTRFPRRSTRDRAVCPTQELKCARSFAVYDRAEIIRYVESAINVSLYGFSEFHLEPDSRCTFSIGTLPCS